MSRALGMRACYSLAQLRHLEHKALSTLHLSEDELMARAGRAALNALQLHYPRVQTLAIFCGSGNNAGDGYVLARLAKEAGLHVFIYQCSPIENLPPAALRAALLAQELNLTYLSLDDPIDADVALLVDAILGIGLRADVRSPLKDAIMMMNDSALPVMALDLPSGLHADTGQILGVCVKADLTVTFIADKLGLYTLDGPDVSGKIVCDAIGLDKLIAAEHAQVSLLNLSFLKKNLQTRLKNSHKGDFGSVLIIGGGLGMPGAAWLAAASALSVGAGSVRVATRPEYATGFWANLPEAMVYAIVDAKELDILLASSTVCVLGPGLGESAWAKALFARVIVAQIPLVIDASALRLLAAGHHQDDHWVLTPHPGEAAALLGITTAELQSDRYQAVRAIQQRYGGNVVLKGVGTLLATEAETQLCIEGNPGMAVAGMGDVLSGMIGGLIAQGLTTSCAAGLAVSLHAHAGDALAQAEGPRGLLAGEMLPYLRRLVNE